MGRRGSLTRSGDPGFYTFRDEFAGGVVNTGLWDKQDTGGHIVVSRGRVSIGGNGNWAQEALSGQTALSRSLCGILGWSFRPGISRGKMFLGFDQNLHPSPPNVTGRGLALDVAAASSYQFCDLAGAVTSNPAKRTRNIDYLGAIIFRPSGGCLVAVSQPGPGGQFAQYPQATLLMVYDQDGTSTARLTSLRPLAAAFANGSSLPGIKFCRIRPPSCLLPAFATDYGAASVYDRPAYTGSIAGHTTSIGGKTWATPQNQIDADGNGNFSRHSGSGFSRSQFDNGSVARIWEMTFVAGTTTSCGIIFRSNSANTQHYEFGIATGGGGWVLSNTTDGTCASNPAFTITAGQTYHLRIEDWGTSGIGVYINDVDVFGGLVTGASVGRFTTNTYLGFDFGGTDTSTAKAPVVWPSTITLPAGFEMPLPPTPCGTVPITDTFDTATDAAALAGRTTPTGGKVWAVNAGATAVPTTYNPTGTAGVMKLASAANIGLGLVDTGVFDHAIKVTVTIPAANPPDGSHDWFCGAAIRSTDDSNRIYARAIYQNNAPEWELWEVIGGSGSQLNAVNLGAGGIAAGTAYDLEVVVRGNDVAIYHATSGGALELVCQGTTILTSGTKAGPGVIAGGAAVTSGQPSFDGVNVWPQVQ